MAPSEDDPLRALFLRAIEVTAPLVPAGAKGRVLAHVLGEEQPLEDGPRYRISTQLGAGGMGVVHRAFDTVLQREVAIKRIRGGTKTAAGLALARLEQEALTLASLSHPNIVTIHDVVSEGGELHVVMELVAGCSVRSWLEQTERSWPEIVSVFERAGRGLVAAHAAGIVHRDFKPTNVMVGDDGAVVKVIDFGLARATEDDSSPSRGSSSSPSRSWTQGAGTLPYMAPEQRNGHTEPASDQYGFCVSLYEALTRDRPSWSADEPGVRTQADRQQLEQRLAMSGAPRRIRTAIVRGLAADSRARFTSMSALVARLTPPPVRWAWWLAATAGALVLTAALTMRSDDPCALMDAAASEMWSADRRALVQQRTTGFEREIDRFVDGWRGRARLLCEAQTEGSGQHERQAQERLCLQRSLDRVDVFVAALTEDRLSGNPDALFAELVSFECDDSEWLLISATPGTFDAVDRETMRSVDEIYVQALDGDVAAQASLLGALVTQEATPARVRTWGLARLGHLYDIQGRYEQAAGVLERALIEAEAADDPILRGILQSELAAAVANLPGRQAEAMSLARRAIAALDGNPAGQPHRAGAQGALAVAAWRNGDPATAYDAAARGLVLLDARSPGSVAEARAIDLAWAQLVNLRAMAEEQRGLADQALASYREAAERIERSWPQHPDRARILGSLGLLERDMGRLDLAEDHLREAMALAREQGLETLAATTAMNLGNTMLAAERLEQALAIYDEVRLPDGASVHDRAELSYNRAIALQRLGRASEAAEGYAETLALLAGAPGSIDVRYGALLGRGLALLELERTELARQDLTDALALEAEDVGPGDAIDLRLGLALTLPADEPSRITSLVEHARELAVQAGPERARQLEAWRARFATAGRWWPSDSD
jgi:tetratricopeptide (TPR) repeat protein